MSLKDAINRTTNLVATAIAALAGFAFLPEVFVEDHLSYKVDDALLFLIGLGAVAWYKKGKNRFSRSVLPVLLVFAGLVVKTAGVIVEIKDKDDVGDDFGGLILFLLGSLFIAWIYVKSKKLLASTK